jgi:hypothetical protein
MFEERGGVAIREKGRGERDRERENWDDERRAQ